MGLSQPCLPHRPPRLTITSCRIGRGGLYLSVHLQQIPAFKRRLDRDARVATVPEFSGRVSSGRMTQCRLTALYIRFVVLFVAARMDGVYSPH